MTWSDDGRASFSYGAEREHGQPHVVWRQIRTVANSSRKPCNGIPIVMETSCPTLSGEIPIRRPPSQVSVQKGFVSVPSDQAWFFNQELQAAKRKADEELAAGRGPCTAPPRPCSSTSTT